MLSSGVVREETVACAPTLLETRTAPGKFCREDTTKGLPHAFAPEYCVRNTFIDSVPSRRPSLEDFLPRSRCYSAPSPVLGPRMRRGSTIDPVLEETFLELGEPDLSASSYNICAPQQSLCAPWSAVPAVYDAHASGSSGQHGSPPLIINPMNLYSAGIQMMPPVIAFSAAPAADLMSPKERAGLRPMPTAQSTALECVQIADSNQQLASEGSIGHNDGVCRPCAWYHSAKGCQTGTSCKFCHACGPGELKRRKKEKNMLLASRNTNRRA